MQSSDIKVKACGCDSL